MAFYVRESLSSVDTFSIFSPFNISVISKLLMVPNPAPELYSSERIQEFYDIQRGLLSQRVINPSQTFNFVAVLDRKKTNINSSLPYFVHAVIICGVFSCYLRGSRLICQMWNRFFFKKKVSAQVFGVSRLSRAPRRRGSYKTSHILLFRCFNDPTGSTYVLELRGGPVNLAWCSFFSKRFMT